MLKETTVEKYEYSSQKTIKTCESLMIHRRYRLHVIHMQKAVKAAAVKAQIPEKATPPSVISEILTPSSIINWI